jgi:sterol desaturase/sphingolipid hydroxylase (fatty acid hydroxylase superfamily)
MNYKKNYVQRLLFELLCVTVVVGIPFAVKLDGLSGWAKITLLGYLSTVIDYLCFPYLSQNFHTLEKHGYSKLTVWFTMLFNLLATNTLVGAIYYYAPIDEVSWYVPLKVFVNLCITEFWFTFAHMCLHYTVWGARIHLMHHCCKQASWSTNLVFHPLDMMLEFSGPALSILFMHRYVWDDPATLVVSTVVMHLWYALDHSATLKLPHTKHHAHIDSQYSIYIQKRIPLKIQEVVKKLLKIEHKKKHL